MGAASELRHVEYTVDKETSASDSSLVAAGSVSVNFFREGVTVNQSNVTIDDTAGGVSVTLYDVADIKVGDTLEKFSASDWEEPTNTVTVESITNQTTAKLKRVTTTSVVVDTGDRLVIKSRLPTLYKDDRGTTTESAAGLLTTSSSGYAEAYIANANYDVVISATGLTTTLQFDQATGPTPHQFHLRDEGIVSDGTTENQSDLDDFITKYERSTPMRRIWVPTGDAIIEDAQDIGTDNVDMEGEAGSTLKAKTGTTPGDIFYISGTARNVFRLRGVTFDGNNVALNALRLEGTKEVWIENCIFQNADTVGLLLGLTGHAATKYVQRFYINGNRFLSCDAKGLLVYSAFMGEICSNEFDTIGGNAIEVNPTGTTDECYHFSIQDNRFNAVTGIGIYVDGLAASGTRNVPYHLRIAGNQMDDVTGVGIHVVKMYEASVVDNQIYAAGAQGILFQSCINGKIVDNQMRRGAGAASGIHLQQAPSSGFDNIYVRVTGNHVTGFTHNGILASDCDKCSIHDNMIWGNNTVGTSDYAGIWLDRVASGNSDSNKITNNTVASNKHPTVPDAGYGIRINESTVRYTLVEGNHVSDHDGVEISDAGTDTVLGTNFDDSL